MLRRRFTQALLLVAGISLLAGTGTVAASSHRSEADS
jgi:hypothetical protein